MPCAGESLARYSACMPGESITALCVWDPFAEGQSTATAGGASAEGAATAAARVGEMAEGGASGQRDEQAAPSSPLRSHPIAFSPESTAAAAGAAPGLQAVAPKAQPWGGFIVVGTSIDQSGCGEQPTGAGKEWDDEGSTALQGRLMLLQLKDFSSAGRAAAPAGEGAAAAWEEPPRRQLHFFPVAQLHLPSRVLALCPGTANLRGRPCGSSGASGSGGTSSRLFASVGRRLVAYEWVAREQLLRRVAWIPTNRPLASLQVSLRCSRRALQGMHESLAGHA